MKYRQGVILAARIGQEDRQKAFPATTFRDLMAEHRPHRTVNVADHRGENHRRALLQGWFRSPHQPVIQGGIKTVILFLSTGQHGIFHIFRRGHENWREVESHLLPLGHSAIHVEQVRVAHDLGQIRKPMFGKEFTNLFGHHEQIVDHMLRIPFKTLSQNGILRGHANRTGVQMALAHHDAPQSDQGRRRKAEFLGPEQCSDDHVPPGSHASVHFDPYTRSKSVHHQGLVGLGDAQFPWRPGMLDARLG